LPAKAASSAAILLQGELVPDIDEETAVFVAVGEDRERLLRETEQNAVRATTVEVIDEDGNATPTRSLSRRRKLTIAMFVLFVIGTVATFSIAFPRKGEPTAPPPTTDPRTTIRFSIMEDVIGSSFEDDFFPSSTHQFEALLRLVDQDPAYLAVDTNSTTLLERFPAAHFFLPCRESHGRIKLGGFLRIQYAYGTVRHNPYLLDTDG
jgi:hypothetical protein